MTMTEEQKKLQEAIETCKKTIEKADEVKAIVAKFGGKVYNCRFDKALKAVGCFVEHYSYSNFFTVHRRKENSYTMDYNTELFKFNPVANKRIDAGKISDDIDIQVAMLRERITKYEQEIAVGEEFIEKLNKKLERITREIAKMNLSPEFVDAYAHRVDKCYGHGLF